MAKATEKSIFDKKYVAESQAKAAAEKAGMSSAKIEKIGGMWMVIKPEIAKVENKAPAKAAKAQKATPPKVTNKAPAKAAKPAPTVTNNTPRQKGRPISAEALKTRKRALTLFEKMVTENEKEVTVKGVTKALKTKKVTVSNTIRWAESVGIIKRMGLKLKDGKPGRKEVFYTLQPKALEKLASAA